MFAYACSKATAIELYPPFFIEFTNKAIMPKWNWTSVIIDGTWGGILFGLTTFLYYKLRPYLPNV